MVYVSPTYQPLDDERDAERCPICEELITYAGAPCSCFWR